MRIWHNIVAMNASRQYNIVGKRKAKHIEKLSSGYCINRAADDAAGLSISEKMRRQARGLMKGVENAQDGVSLCHVADGALDEVTGMLQRMNELSVKAANDTNSAADRSFIQTEIDQLLSEIDRISDTTTFNEQNLFGGSSETAAINAISTVAYSASGITPYAASVTCGDFTVTGGTEGVDFKYANNTLTVLTGTAITVSGTTSGNRIFVNSGVNANITLSNVNINVGSGAAFQIADNSKGKVTITLAGNNTLKSGRDCAGLQKNGNASSGTLRITGSGTLTAQGGFNAAGIGSSHFNHANNIVISGGKITAKGGMFGAGIGGSGGGGNAGNITITGGTVTATGGDNAAGIGGGSDYYNQNGNGENITITGGTVTATGGNNAAGIGGGTAGKGGNITIKGGIVTVTGGGNGADHIGSGQKGPSTSADAKRLGGIITEGGVTTNYGGNTGGGEGGFSTGQTKQWWIHSGVEPGDGILLTIGRMNTKILGMDGLDVTTVEGASGAIEMIKGAIVQVSAIRSEIGAQQNRLEHTINNENNIVENTMAAESRIRDTDIAEEVVEFSITNILAQAGGAMLAQAKTSSQDVLSLLQ